jgi:hypothetical protein
MATMSSSQRRYTCKHSKPNGEFLYPYVKQPSEGVVMARLLVLAKGRRKGQISVAKPDDHVWGAMEDKRQYQRKHGNTDNWPGTFVIVDLVGMSIEEATALADPVVTYKDGEIDPIDGKPKRIATIHHNSRGLVDFDAMTDTPERGDDLTANRTVSRDVSEVRQHITERTSG